MRYVAFKLICEREVCVKVDGGGGGVAEGKSYPTFLLRNLWTTTKCGIIEAKCSAFEILNLLSKMCALKNCSRSVPYSPTTPN